MFWFNTPGHAKHSRRSIDIQSLEDRVLFSVSMPVDLSVAPDLAEVSIVQVHDVPQMQDVENVQDEQDVQVDDSLPRSAWADTTHDPRTGIAAEAPQPDRQHAALSTVPPSSDSRRFAVGDFNHDGIINAQDIDLLVERLHKGDYEQGFDLNRDGHIDAMDLDHMVRKILATEYGDANLDGRVDDLDSKILTLNMFGPATGWGNGDFNGDGVVDGQDFMLWNRHKLAQITPATWIELAYLEPINPSPAAHIADVAFPTQETADVPSLQRRSDLWTADNGPQHGPRLEIVSTLDAITAELATTTSSNDESQAAHPLSASNNPNGLEAWLEKKRHLLKAHAMYPIAIDLRHLSSMDFGVIDDKTLFRRFD